jgi:hypothetical protein
VTADFQEKFCAWIRPSKRRRRHAMLASSCSFDAPGLRLAVRGLSCVFWLPESMSIVLTTFAKSRLFAANASRSPLFGPETPENFEARLNAQTPLHDLQGYAPFCRLHVHQNWTSARCMAVPITPENQHLLRSGYEARTADELPVLVRWFEGVQPPRASYLLVILYNSAQLLREGTPISADWGVVGCLCTAQAEEIPMTPITVLRNALGVSEGGSGVSLDRAAYARSVAFWSQHANCR